METVRRNPTRSRPAFVLVAVGWVVLSTVLASTVLASPAVAQPATSSPGAVDRSLELARQAATAYKEGTFEEAIALYERAHEESPDPISLHNIGRCYEAVGSRKLGDLEPTEAEPGQLLVVVRDLRAAVEHYERFLAAEPEAASRPAVEQRVRALRAQMKLLDDLATRPRREPAVPPERTPARIAAPWLVAGAGGAVLTAGIIVAVLARSREEASNDPAASGKDTVAAADDARRHAVAANALFGVGGALSIAGAVWGIADVVTVPTSAAAPTARLRVGPAFVGAIVDF